MAREVTVCAPVVPCVKLLYKSFSSFYRVHLGLVDVALSLRTQSI